eukprot:scpid33104/ scgid14748/ Leucine-rich PPR motif-containing protein, mitochondrial; 130 kDa leucine-rich protein
MAALTLFHGCISRGLYRQCRCVTSSLFSCRPSISVRYATVNADATSKIENVDSRVYNHAENELAKLDREIWDSTNRADSFLRHLAYSPSLANQEERLRLAAMFLNKAKVTNLEMTLSRFNLLLQVLVQGEHDFDPNDFSEWMGQCSVDPDVVTCNLLIMAFSQRGNLSGAVAILQLMRKNDFTIGELVYSSLITAYSRAGELDKSFKIMALMEANGVQPSHVSFRALLFACADAGASEKLAEVLKMASKANVFIEYSSLRDLLLQLGNCGDIQGMVVVLNETRDLVFMRNYLAEVMQLLIGQDKVQCALLIYEHLLHLPVEPQSAKKAAASVEHRADTGFLEGVLSSIQDPDLQRQVLLKAQTQVPSKSRIMPLLLRHQLDTAGLVKEALKTFTFMNENRLAVYPHWLQEVLGQAAEAGDVRTAVRLLSMFTSMGLKPTQLMLTMTMDAAAKARVPMQTFLSYMRCVKLSSDLASGLSRACSSFPQADVYSGLLELVRQQRRLNQWEGQKQQQLYLREPINVNKACKHLAELCKERTIAEAVTYLEDLLDSCDYKSAVGVISWAVNENKRLVLSIQQSFFSELLEQLCTSQLSKEFFDLSRIVRDLGIAPPDSWKGLALSMHISADNIEAARLLYDMILDSKHEALLVPFEFQRAFFDALLAKSDHAAIIKYWERLHPLEVPWVRQKRGMEVRATVASSYIQSHRLDSAQEMLFLTQVPPPDTVLYDLVRGYTTEKRYAACMDIYDRLKKCTYPGGRKKYEATLLGVLKASVEIPRRDVLQELYTDLSAGGTKLPPINNLMVEVLCNDNQPHKARQLLAPHHVDGRLLWKVFSAYLCHKQQGSLKQCQAMLLRLNALKCYGFVPSFLGALLDGEDDLAARILKQPGCSLPTGEVLDVFIKPVVLSQQWPLLHRFFQTVNHHPSSSRFMEESLQLMVTTGNREAGFLLHDQFREVPVLTRTKHLLKSTTVPVSSAEKSKDELGSLDKNIFNLLVEAPV